MVTIPVCPREDASVYAGESLMSVSVFGLHGECEVERRMMADPAFLIERTS